MANLTLKSFQQIVGAMVGKMSAETPITDFSDGSNVLTLLEAAAQEDFQQYVQMLAIIRTFNLDTTEGEDLDNRAVEFGLTRKAQTTHSGFVTISDDRFSKISTKVYAGLPGPVAGVTLLRVDDASSFPATGSVFVGRGSAASEGPIAYSTTPVDQTAFWEITLDTALLNDHGTDESIILSQFGNRVVEAGTEVEIPETDFSESIIFETNQALTLLDGENSIDNVLITAIEAGGFRVTSNSIVSFVGEPFPGAQVTNPLPFVNGRDLETDQELRDRIRDTVQSLSRGTSQSVQAGVLGLIDEDSNSSVVSVSVVPPVILADGPTKVFIDNGRGLEPSLDSIGLETVLNLATGGEKFFQLLNFPVSKALLITQKKEPFNLVGTETLIITVGTDEETFIFLASDFSTSGSARATEVAEAINNRSNLLEARTITDSTGKSVIVNPVARENENLTIAAESTANVTLNFSSQEVATLKLYKNDKLLTKDGLTASILSQAQPFDFSTNEVTTTDSNISVISGSKIIDKSVAGPVDFFNQLVHPGDYIKVDSDPDSFYTKVRSVISNTKFILESEYPAGTTAGPGFSNDITIWNSPQLEVSANGDQDETEIVSFGPNDFVNSLQSLASEVFTRMDLEVNLSKTELAVNNTKIKVLSEIENSSDSKMQILGGQGSVSLGFGSVVTSTSGALSGTITATSGSREITGSGTLFLTELQEGQWIKLDADGPGAWTKIEVIETDTKIYFTEFYRGPGSGGSLDFSAITFSTLEQGANKDYVLNRSNGQIELEVPLIAGDIITAGSINTRAFVDSLQETFDFQSLAPPVNLIICVDGGFEGTVTTGDASGPPPFFNTFIDTSLIGFEANLFDGFFIEWTSGDNEGEVDEVTSYDTATGEIIISSGTSNPIVIGDKFRMCQKIEFIPATDFIDSANATADEVITVINDQLLGGKAEKLESGSVRVRTSNFEENSSIQIKDSNANTVLVYPTTLQTNQLTNLASIISGNSDRDGNPIAIGYTIGPDQNLVMILDGDSANKTFSVNTRVTGTAASSGAGTFADSSLTSKYSTNDFFKDFFIYWTSGTNTATVQLVDSYTAATGTFVVSTVFPGVLPTFSDGDEFAIVPRTAENVIKILNDLNTTTLSLVGTAEVVGISGDFVQISTSTPGSDGKVFITGGTANSLGISIISVPSAAPANDVTINSVAGLSEGLMTLLTVDGIITSGDGSIPFDSFTDTSMITIFPGVFSGLEIEFLTGVNAGHKTTVSSYTNTTGAFTLTTATPNAISIGDSFRIGRSAFVVSITGTSAPFTVELNDPSNSPIDVTVYTPERSSAIRDRNGLNFSNIQLEGVDGYKFFTNLIQKTQFTIDGLERDLENFPGLGAGGTQFEVLPPVLRKLRLEVDVTPDEGISLTSISADVANAISEYINSRGVGQDVVLSEVVAAAQSIIGVFDVEVLNFTENIVIADGELARIDSIDLVVG